MRVNASDAGRDLEAYRVVSDGLLTERRERVIVRVKHWSSKSVNASDIADIVHATLPPWEGEPVRVLIFATTGSFTQEAVRWVESHNSGSCSATGTRNSPPPSTRCSPPRAST
jgi:Restriction endonuclease